MILEKMTRLGTLTRSANEYGAFYRRIEGYQFARNGEFCGRRWSTGPECIVRPDRPVPMGIYSSRALPESVENRAFWSYG